MRRYGPPPDAPDVALLAEGVDRNVDLDEGLTNSQMSPSSRRAWIEISFDFPLCGDDSVALLAEGVDRNILPKEDPRMDMGSPSSRRAWIEI